MRRLTAWLLTVLISLTISIHAQELTASLTHYSTADGLPSNAVSDIIADKYGYIWIATWNGLCRFDGYHFRNYATGSASGIPLLHNRILNLLADTNGNIWLRMYDGRIFVLDRRTDHIMHAFGDNDGTPIRTTARLAADTQGHVYALINGKNLYQLELRDSHVTTAVYSTHRHVNAFCLTDGGTLWLAENNTLTVLRTSTLVPLWQIRLPDGERVTTLCSRDRHVYAGTLSGKIFRLTATKEKPAQLLIQQQEGSITAVYADTKGLIWFSTQQQGISCFYPADGRVRHFSQQVPIPEFDAYGASFSETGNTLWARMNHGGFGYYNRAADTFNYFHNHPDNPWNLSNTVSTYLAQSDGVVWLSTLRRGMERLDLLNRQIQRKELEPGAMTYGKNEIRAMLYDTHEHQLFIGNKAGELYVYPDHGSAYKIDCDTDGKPFGRIYGLMQDSKGNIWLSTKFNGLYLLRPSGKGSYATTHFQKDSSSPQSINSNEVYITTEDNDSNIWIATYGGGVNLLISNGNGSYSFAHADNLMRTYPKDIFRKVRTLATASDGTVWAGTSDGILLLRYDRQRRQFDISPLRQPKTGNERMVGTDIIHIVRAPNGKMWIATNGGGLSCAERQEKGVWHFSNYGTKDGLPSDEIWAITFDNHGTAWFTTEQNICSYDTDKHLLTTFTRQDGLDDVTCSEGAALTLPDGRMLFGTLNGYYLVDRSYLAAVKGKALQLRITDFFVNDRLMSPRLNDIYDYDVPDSGAVRLPSRTSVFAFRFAALNYQLQHRVHYQYMLEGHDRQWYNAGDSRMVSYSDIPAGTYTFRVRAFLLAAPDQFDECTLQVVVPPYLWASPAALWLYLLLAVAAVVGWYLLYRRRQKRLAQMRVIHIGPQEIAFQHKDDYDFVREQLDWLESHYAEADLKIDDMADASALSRTSYYNKLKLLTGLSPKELVSDFRLKKACMFLESSSLTIAEVAYRTGFNDPVYFTRIFKQKTGKTPTKYREEHKNPPKNLEDNQ